MLDRSSTPFTLSQARILTPEGLIDGAVDIEAA